MKKKRIYSILHIFRYPDAQVDPIELWDDIIESRMVFIEDISTFADEEVWGYFRS